MSFYCIKEKQGALIFETEDKETKNMDNDKKKVIDEMIKKFKGEEGERLAMMPIIRWLDDKGAQNKDATVILSQKSTLELVEQTMEQILMDDTFDDLLDKKFAQLRKLQRL